ncbi:Assembly factor cbp4 [Exophiala xenobiotica]|uniref:Cytochrome b mRNA-processing protein 4 n=1 Tax=Vermiconidia calcicola TaxID=1690605 RepID=A0AAV9QJ46_9PEZI|nr:Assembly factor cbp4 [Exophiala xenobiotica]KAK5544051.1 Assembly factor cbp4 [Vermiconidia calcicola]KAK5547669.1 Assembly factor cbp4 [Chaetothyriales sp. CCFEE 6169]KAK5559589.1 Assembly factor cbp4 [Exophiala xenobiotica]
MASRGGMYARMAAVFITFCVGGPALMYYVTPAEGEVFKRFNPDLQKRNLELRDQRTKDYEIFLSQLKEYSKSDKPIWEAAADAQRQAKEQLLQKEAEDRALQQKMRDEMRAQAHGR